MDCSICLCAVDATTSSVRTSCNHTFHFGCLATWSKTNTSCPMCRQAFMESDTPDWSRELIVPWDISDLPMPGTNREMFASSMMDFDGADRIRILTEGTGGAGRTSIIDHLIGRSGTWRRALNDHLQSRLSARPIDQVPYDGLDPINVEFIMEHAMVTRRRAEAYLQFFGDPIETVMCLAAAPEEPIPDFRERPRPPLEEVYVQRWTGNRDRTGFHYRHRDGYTSS